MTGIVIVGQGRMARAHLAAWTALGLGPAIRYVCVRTPGVAMPGTDGVRYVTDLASALADPQVDMVSICTPPSTHASLAVRALRADVNVLLEKPIATSLADAAAIAAAVRLSSAQLMVAQLLRFESGYRRLQADVASGRLGRIRTVVASRAIPRPAEGWWNDPASSGGPLVDVATHDFDQANLALGRARTVASFRDGPAGSGPYHTTVEYEGGGRAQVATLVDADPDIPLASRFEVIGSRGRAVYEMRDSLNGRERSYRTVPETGGSSIVEGEDPFVAEIRYFVECVERGSPPMRSDGQSAIAALAVGLAAQRSARRGSAALEVV